MDVTFSSRELSCSSCRSLDPVARSLLIELRRLEQPSDGLPVSLSIGEACKRLNTTQRPVQKAFKALSMLGWIEEAAAAPGRRRAFLLKNPATVAYG